MKKGNLAIEVLKEIPEQVVGYCDSVGWKPNRMANNMVQGMAGKLAKGGLLAGLKDAATEGTE
jgi:hypothetical protein